MECTQARPLQRIRLRRPFSPNSRAMGGSRECIVGETAEVGIRTLENTRPVNPETVSPSLQTWETHKDASRSETEAQNGSRLGDCGNPSWGAVEATRERGRHAMSVLRWLCRMSRPESGVHLFFLPSSPGYAAVSRRLTISDAISENLRSDIG